MALIDANDSNFDEIVNSNEMVIVKFYAGWCGSCRMFKPKYKRMSENEAFNNVAFLYVNAEENTEIRKKVGVDNLPYFAAFKKGNLIEGGAMAKEEAVTDLINKL